MIDKVRLYLCLVRSVSMNVVTSLLLLQWSIPCRWRGTAAVGCILVQSDNPLDRGQEPCAPDPCLRWVIKGGLGLWLISEQGADNVCVKGGNGWEEKGVRERVRREGSEGEGSRSIYTITWVVKRRGTDMNQGVSLRLWWWWLLMVVIYLILWWYNLLPPPLLKYGHTEDVDRESPSAPPL